MNIVKRDSGNVFMHEYNLLIIIIIIIEREISHSMKAT